METINVIDWIYPLLPVIPGVTWQADWPDDFVSLPRGCYQLAEDATGRVTTSGESTTRVGIYLHFWVSTPGERADIDQLITATMNALSMSRTMRRHTVEMYSDGTKAYRSTTIWSGEYNNGTKEMCRPN